ncbi:hypothetical protein QYE76_064459 [Lolium multiflorum]|uniref:RNase H type-1 domain-containing protein n=1 Tax=Lolium multiflorum TaxID=4521 RepID=A0AAD8WA03_LOLMU|nr:hypothetical protein QYE76_064459 [Lolium multiflorum]
MSSDDGVVEKSWKALWAIKAPGKMHITLWRFAHNCLPSGQQLLRLWDGVKERFGIQLGRKCFSTPKKWLFDFLARCSGDEATTLAVSFWHLWDARNKLREEGGTIDPSSVARKVTAYIDMIQTHMIQANSIPRRETSAAVSWSPPMEGKLMINVDAALFKTSQSMGMGFLVRGHSGDCMLARCDKISNVTSPEMAEALAVRGALSFAKEEGLDNFICASDCLSVVQRIPPHVHEPSSIDTPPPPQPAAASLPGTELTVTAAQPSRPQGVHRIVAMDNDDEMMVQLFTEEQNAEAVRRLQHSDEWNTEN